MKVLPSLSFLLLVVLVALVERSLAFHLQSRPSRTTSSSRLYIGNFLSGVTGTPPSKPLLTQELQDSLVAGTSLQDKELKCVYKASQDGWSAVNFHQCVDGKGSGLVVALSRSGQVFGGFNPNGWSSTDDYYSSNSAFLWFAQGTKATKCPVLTGGTLRARQGIIIANAIREQVKSHLPSLIALGVRKRRCL